MMEEEKSVDRIIIEYEDGTTKELDCGMAISVSPSVEPEGDVNVTATMVRMKGEDLFNVIYAMVELGIKLGLFNNEKEDAE